MTPAFACSDGITKILPKRLTIWELLYAAEGKKEEAIATLTGAVDHGLQPRGISK